MKINIKLLLIFICFWAISNAQENTDLSDEPLIGNTVNPLNLKNSDYTLPEQPTADIYEYEGSSNVNRESSKGNTTESKYVFEDDVDDIQNTIKNVTQWAGDDTPYGKTFSYDAKALNYDRFKNSPCFEKLGFSPFRTPEEQEQMYQTCESEHYKNLVIKIISSVLIFGFIAYMIYISFKKKKQLSSTTKHQNDVEDK